MKILFLIVIGILFAGCSAIMGKSATVITFPDEAQVTINAKNDELVEIERNGVKIKSDRRGRPGIIEQVLGVAATGLVNDTVNPVPEIN